MSISSTVDSRLDALRAKGYTVMIRSGRLAISPTGAPPEVSEEVRAHREQFIAELLHVPDDLDDVPLKDLRARAWRMVEVIDGAGPYEKRVRFLPEYLRLVDHINRRAP